MKALSFRASGDFARFRCPYTTTSALTYTVMHPIAIKGLIGAIMGIDYEDLYEYTKEMKIGIEVLKPIKKDTQSFNLVPQIKNNGSPTFPSRIEFLRDVCYRIYVIDSDEKLNEIKRVLVNRSYTFTPYLGASEHIAKLQFEGIEEVNNVSQEIGLVNCTIPKEQIILEKNQDVQLCLDRIPVKNEKTREYVKYEKVVFVPGGSMVAQLNYVLKVGDSNVYFF
ncbi:type I-B CRISPR-associated protein Cas5b [Clostridium sp. MSJ-4]|uniref:Type I-B CRISPR-associated protein Cas5b n=1 Tax=Clostridium simiarum TaxID=2841506 RepID=A0ABS6F5Y1_9CLOT|nr:type I-B CRISPR-associated protein Cas5b [Clostridium simiarum]MBU5593274.1 type I-B CRISPR-associated protein Cas5b [Clostridium simiarum]